MNGKEVRGPLAVKRKLCDKKGFKGLSQRSLGERAQLWYECHNLFHGELSEP